MLTRQCGFWTLGCLSVKVSLAICLLSGLGACANTSTGNALEQSLSADPRLKDNPAVFSSPSPTAVANEREERSRLELPPDFPSEIPLYPNAQLIEVQSPPSKSEPIQLRWKSTDPSNYIQAYYQTQFQGKDWEIVNNPTVGEPESLTAKRGNLRVTLSPLPSQGGTTEFAIAYTQDAGNIGTSPSPSEGVASSPASSSPTRSQSPKATLSDASPQPTASPSSQKTAPESNQVPSELRQPIADLAQLGVLEIPGSNEGGIKEVRELPEPNKIITRREFARWLIAANNQIYASRPAKQIRLAVATSDPTFTDVPKTDPDFPAIQGLAEAGIIPSSLSGDKDDTKFRPNEPLTREQLLLWKVPLDTRQALPTANIDAVKERWGFQDASKIDPTASRAVLADFNNGDLANIRRVFGFTTLFQPKKSVTRAQAAASLWYFGTSGEGLSAQDALSAKAQTNQTKQ